MEAFEYDALPGRVVFGWGARARLTAELERLGAKRVFLVASRSATRVADELAEALGPRLAGRWAEVVEHVPVAVVKRARDAARAAGTDMVVCIGGGSAIGLAKAVVLEIEAPVVALPTTYAGSEMTPVYGLTEGTHKRTGRDLRVLPRVVIYDPELTMGLPVGISVASALNALAHCVEGLYGPGGNPVTTAAALEGIRVLTTAIPRLVANPGEPAVRSDLCLGAYLAGTVIATVGVGIHHRTCHVLGGTFGLPHAASNAVVLPHALAYNALEIPAALARIADAMRTDDPPATTFDLVAGAGLPTSLRDLGLSETALDDVAARVVAETPANPRPVEPTWVRRMLDDAWRGVRPSARRDE